MVSMARFVTMAGMTQMLLWSAGNWDFHLAVCAE